jgi:hypothetical protein
LNELLSSKNAGAPEIKITPQDVITAHITTTGGIATNGTPVSNTSTTVGSEGSTSPTSIGSNGSSVGSPVNSPISGTSTVQTGGITPAGVNITIGNVVVSSDPSGGYNPNNGPAMPAYQGSGAAPAGSAFYQGPTTYGNAPASPHSQQYQQPQYGGQVQMPASAGYQPSPTHFNNNGQPQVQFSGSGSNVYASQPQPQVAFAQAPASPHHHQQHHHSPQPRMLRCAGCGYDIAIAPSTPNGTQLSCPQCRGMFTLQ